MFIAATHNGISRLYETFGNGGSAETLERTLSPKRDVAHVVPAEPAAAAREVVAPQQQQLRADRLAGLAQLLREQPAAVPAELLREEQALDPEGDDARVRRRTCCRRTIARPGAQAELLRVLQKQRVEISRATAPFTVHGARARGGAAARWTRRRRGGGDAATRAAGQPRGTDARKRARSRRAATSSAWISRTRASPTRCSTTSTGRRTIRRRNPYDDTGWTFPEGFTVQAVRVIDAKVLDAPMERVHGRRSARRAA